MATARVFLVKVEEIQRAGNAMTLFLDCFVFVTGESQVQRHTMDVTISSFASNTFKNQMRQGIVDWVLGHLGDTVVNVILPDFAPI